MRGVLLTASALKSRTVGGLGGQEARGPGRPPSTPSRMHPKIMLYPWEFVLKLRSMEGNNTAAGRGLKAFVESETFTSRRTHLELLYVTWNA